MTALRDAIDYTTLGWVKPELDETLRQTQHEIEGYADDPADPSRMRFAAGFLHQVQGTLRMVELYAPAMVAEEMEALAKAIASGQVANRDEACSSLMRGVVLLPDYLERLQGGHKDIPIVLLPLLNELRSARGEKGLSESVLFAPDLDRPLPVTLPQPVDTPVRQRETDAQPLLSDLRESLAGWSETTPGDYATLTQALQGLLGLASEPAARRMLWVATETAAALRDGGLGSAYSLREAFGSVEREARREFGEGDGSARAPHSQLECTRQLLYHVAQASESHPALDALRATFGLVGEAPSESELAHARGSMSGRNRALLDTVAGAIKEDLLRIKDALDLHLRTNRSDAGELQPQVVALDRVADTLGMLGLGVARDVVLQQRDALRELTSSNRPTDEDALLDVAGALLYVDASLDDQVARLGQPGLGEQEDLIANESHKVLEVLVREAIANFADARQGFVAFVETNWDHAQLSEVPRLLAEVSGALRMLELPEPANYLEGVRRYTEAELLSRKRVPNGRQLDTLADALASLEYYLEAVRDRRQNSEEILAITRQSLESLRYWPLPQSETVAVVQDETLDRIDAIVAAEANPAAAVAAVPAVARQGVEAGSGGFDFSNDEIDDEIREIFLEEFEEEIANLGQLLPQWREQPEQLDRLRPIRRVFHTLKGSGRLVGARVLGEFSWKVENMLNRVLDGTRPPTPAVLALVDHAFNTLPMLHAALSGATPLAIDLSGIEAVADRLAAGEEAYYTAPASFAAAQSGPLEVPYDGIEVEEIILEAPQEEMPAATALATELRAVTVDPVLLEILGVEVDGHLQTVDAWLERSRLSPQPADDALLRAIHTMNGAFAMTEVPEIVDATLPAEAYVKRLLASGRVPEAEGIAALSELATQIRATVAGLEAPESMVPVQTMLAVRLIDLRDSLPEPSVSIFGLDEETPAVDLSEEPAPTEEDIAAQADAQRVELERIEAQERLEIAAIEAAILEAERVEAEQLEAIRVEAEQAEAERIAAERAEAERAAAERAEAERAAVALAAAAEAERLEAERVAQAEAQEQARRQAEQAEAERIAQEQALEAQRLEAERIAAEQAEAARVEAERLEAERIAAERAEAERIATERAEAQRIEVERAEAERLAAEQAEAERVAAATPAPETESNEVETGADAGSDSAVATLLAGVMASTEDPDEALDLTDLDPELVDIFVEEAGDILDHADGLLARLREAPTDREPVVGLQRDLHTLKGGARMAGIMAVGDLGHAMETLLEAVAEHRCELGRDGVPLLERGFDRLHAMLGRVAARRAVAVPVGLIEEFDARARGESISDAPRSVASTAAPQPVVELKPLSAPLEAGQGEEDDIAVRAPQEQVRIRADLLDRLVNYAGEVAIYRARLEQQLGAFRSAMGEMEQTNARLRDQLRRLDIETEAQIIARYQREHETSDQTFDPLELDRFSTLQQLSRGLGESAADLASLQGSMEDLTRQYETLLLQQSRVSSDLQEGLMRTRMVPFDALVPRLRRVIRQAASETGKQVQLKLDGAQGELDRNVLERMTAPLEHMLRNAVAHGLETPEQRRKAGKPEEGTVRISMRREGSEVVLEVADDGAGLNRQAIRRRAEERGLVRAGAVLADADLDTLILESGFSTADAVSHLAGRGVGMDVVHSEVRQLGGALDITSRPKQGVTFTMRLPQTLAVTQAVFVRIGETSFAVPIASVRGVGRIGRDELATGGTSYRYGGEDYALHDLGTLLSHAPAKAEGQLQVPLLLIRSGDLRAAVSIDQVLGNREIVVKPVGPQVASVPGIFGATIMGDGSVVVILDIAPLVRRQATQPREVEFAPAAPERGVPLVMVVDDSVTMRKVTGRVLERHNFEVVTAKDGLDALERMTERVPDLMLLDIEMPRMDGYELATTMKLDPRLRNVPIAMITSRTGEKHRQRAFDIGVERYLGKPYQEQELMRNVFDLLGLTRDHA
ncbi:chemosensory pili system protein ChpA (sensor histidine kinase/response regulator) [Luteimonas cucumeris]|uniref:Chemotaxis protein CheA n=1 Tax=Luteimonas cucumeris TaxID=985012 RepID=A0A562L514_9GAMM|nr:Hpt domain-containing protein [Luteimonas cucumeris]TWI02738.1 chemosensory pili system protein ChpA (sensor histidine kinase/response regulator) [Luteimonas cucumeris]